MQRIQKVTRVSGSHFVCRYSPRLYVAYCTWYIVGTLLAMQIRFVGFQHVQSGEHMAALGVFLLLQASAKLADLATPPTWVPF